MNTLLFDGNSLYARSWYAAEHAELGPDAALGFSIKTVLLLLNPMSDRLGCYVDSTLFAWDNRQNPLKERSEKPEIYHQTKDRLKKILKTLLGTANYEHPDYEGDDIVATAALKTSKSDKAYVITADKDLQQLQKDRIQYYCLNTKALLSSTFIARKWNIKHPEQVALALAIIGDHVDNIPGIKGYGPAKNKQLFKLVTEDMNLEQAVSVICSQLSESKQDEFLASLDRTLLKTDVPGVPRPARLQLAMPKVARSIGIPEINELYLDVYREYARNSSEE
jgi:DNA polymerase-1